MVLYKCGKCGGDFHKIRIDLNDPLKIQVCENCYWGKTVVKSEYEKNGKTNKIHTKISH